MSINMEDVRSFITHEEVEDAAGLKKYSSKEDVGMLGIEKQDT